jgi:O-succinylbenzoate synthase
MSALSERLPELHVLALPLRNRFRGIDTREVVIFRGAQGWSEFSPFVEYDDQESLPWLRAALEAADTPAPTPLRQSIPINATLPIVAPEKVAGILAKFDGAKSVKIKVDDFEAGAKVVEATLEVIPDAKIRLDVNGGWSLETARSNLLEYHLRFDSIFEYIEQPCISESDLRELHKDSPIKIAADESIRKNLKGDLTKIKEFADVAIIKWQPLGGFAKALEIASTIELPVTFSSALESGVGISHNLKLAASYPELKYACGLGTRSLFEEDICGDQYLPRGGEIALTEPEPSGLERFVVPTERRIWWENRLMRLLELL